jgi:PAS domain S-box-containing protein
MSLTAKTLLILLLAAATMTAGVYLGTRRLLLPRFLEGERHDVRAVLTRAQNALKDELSQLAATTNDYGAWDRSYEFMLHPSVDYVRTEYQNETLQGLDIDSVTLLDNQQRLVWGKSFGRQDNGSVDPDLSSILRSHPWVKRRLVSASAGAGILLLRGQPLVIAASPILRSDRQGPSRGLLLMTRRIDDALVSSMQSELQDGLSVRSVPDFAPDPGFAAVKSELEGGEGMAVRPLDEKTVAGYELLKDVNGVPALGIKVTTQRTFLRQGLLSLRYLLAGLCLSAVVFVAVTLLMIRHAVLARITDLNNQIRRLGERRELTQHVQVPGKDEISRLGEAVNVMLGALRQSDSQFRLIAENIHQVLWIKDEVTQKISCISPIANQRGGHWQELLSNDEQLLQSVDPEDRVAVEDMLLRQQQGRQGEAEFRVRAPDGQVCWVWRRHFPVFDGQGKLKQTVGVSEDVTEYKSAEEALLRSQDELWNVMMASANKAGSLR